MSDFKLLRRITDLDGGFVGEPTLFDWDDSLQCNVYVRKLASASSFTALNILVRKYIGQLTLARKK